PALRNRTRPEPIGRGSAAKSHRGREAELPQPEPVAADEPAGEQCRPEGHRGEAFRPAGAFRHRGRRSQPGVLEPGVLDRKSTRLNSSHVKISYAVFCLKKKSNT